MNLDSIFDSIGGFFKKVFRQTPKWTVVALSTINTIAPEAEIVLALVDPTAAVVADPIITEVQADLGTAAQLLKSGNTVNLPTFLNAIKANLKNLLVAGHIKDPQSVTKATALVNGISSAIDSIIASIPQAA